MHPASLDPLPPAPRRSLPDALNELCGVLEDLLKRIADTDDVHIRRLRACVRAKMIAVQRDISTLQAPAAETPVTAPRKAAQANPPQA